MISSRQARIIQRTQDQVRDIVCGNIKIGYGDDCPVCECPLLGDELPTKHIRVGGTSIIVCGQPCEMQLMKAFENLFDNK